MIASTNRTVRRWVLFTIVSVLTIGCSSSNDQPEPSTTQQTDQLAANFPDEITEKTAETFINQSVENDNYEQAIAFLKRHSNLPNHKVLKEKVHLNYGLFYEYRGRGDMRSRMTQALRQFIATLQVNPDNAKARAEIEQIMGVYATFPNRTPPGGIVDTLRAMGLAQ